MEPDREDERMPAEQGDGNEDIALQQDELEVAAEEDGGGNANEESDEEHGEESDEEDDTEYEEEYDEEDDTEYEEEYDEEIFSRLMDELHSETFTTFRVDFSEVLDLVLDDVEEVCRALACCNAIDTINLGKMTHRNSWYILTKDREPAWTKFLDAVASLDTIRTLHLGSGNLNGKFVAQVVKALPNVQEIMLRFPLRTLIPEPFLWPLVDAMESHTCPRVDLHLSHVPVLETPRIAPMNVFADGNAFPRLLALEAFHELNLDTCTFSLEECKSLAQILTSNTCKGRSLRIRDCVFLDGGGHFVGSAFATNRFMKRILLDGDFVRDSSFANAFIDALAINKSLDRVCLHAPRRQELYNPKSDEEEYENLVKLIKTVASHNQAIRGLYLYPSQHQFVLDDKTKAEIRQLMKSNFTLHDLRIRSESPLGSILNLNRAGRDYLKDDAGSKSKCIDVLAKVNRDIESTFFHIGENPVLFSNDNDAGGGDNANMASGGSVNRNDAATVVETENRLKAVPTVVEIDATTSHENNNSDNTEAVAALSVKRSALDKVYDMVFSFFGEEFDVDRERNALSRRWWLQNGADAETTIDIVECNGRTNQFQFYVTVRCSSVIIPEEYQLLVDTYLNAFSVNPLGDICFSLDAKGHIEGKTKGLRYCTDWSAHAQLSAFLILDKSVEASRRALDDQIDDAFTAGAGFFPGTGNGDPTTHLDFSVFQKGNHENIERRAGVTVDVGDTTTLLTVYNDPEVITRARCYNRETANDVSSGRKEIKYMLTNRKGDEQYTEWLPLSMLATTTTRQLVNDLPEHCLRPLCLVLGCFRQGHSDERQQEVQDDSTTIDVTDKPIMSAHSDSEESVDSALKSSYDIMDQIICMHLARTEFKRPEDEVDNLIIRFYHKREGGFHRVERFKAIIDLHPQQCKMRYVDFPDLLLHDAIRYKSPLRVIEHIVASNPNALTAVERSNDTPLLMACSSVRHVLEPKVLVLLTTPESARIKDKYGNLPIFVYCRDAVHTRRGINMRVLRTLINAFPKSVHHLNPSGESLLHIVSTSASPRNLPAIRHLAQLTPQFISKKDGNGYTPLHTACSDHVYPDEHRSVEAVRFLAELYPQACQEKCLLRGDDDHEPQENMTPLHLVAGSLASTQEDAMIVELLLEIRPRCAKALTAGRTTALHEFCTQKLRKEEYVPLYANKHTRTLRLLIDAYPEALTIKSHGRYTPLFIACCDRRVDLDGIRLLVEACPEVLEEPDSVSGTALHVIFRESQGELLAKARILAISEEAVKAKDGDGRTPLHILCGEASPLEEKILELCRILIEQCPELPLLQDNHGQTPLHRAIHKSVQHNHYFGEHFAGLVKFLVEVCHRSVQVEDDNGMTPLLLARAINANSRIVDELVLAESATNERQQEVQDDSTTIDVTDKPTASLRVKVFQKGNRENMEKRADVTVNISDTTTLLTVYNHPTVRARARRFNLEIFNDVKSGKKEVRYMLTNWEGDEQYTRWLPLSSLQTRTTRRLVDNLPTRGLRPLCLVLGCFSKQQANEDEVFLTW